MKTGLLIADLHCGHMVGLTPPAWQVKDDRKHKAGPVQRECWDWYQSKVKMLGPFDFVLVNGDAIDGKGAKSGGTEAITTDRDEQVEMAYAAVRHAIAPKTTVLFTYGTAYHTGDDEDFENRLATKFDAKIGAHEWLLVDGVTIDFKHHVGSSQVPYGRHTAISKERVWNLLWSEMDQCPKSDIIVRSHTHSYSGAFGAKWLAMTTPALQAMGSKYGARRCSGTVDFGLIVLKINNGSYTWETHLLESRASRSRVTRL